MHGVSEIIAIILILMITIAIAGVAYTFMSSTMASTTSSASSSISTTTSSMLSSFIIENMDMSNIYLRNTGQTTISNISVYVNDEAVVFNITPESIGAGEIGTIKVYSFMKDGDSVKVASTQGISSVKIQSNLCKQTVGCWQLNEGSDMAFYDSSPFGITGMLYGGTWTSGSNAGITLSGPGTYANAYGLSIGNEVSTRLNANLGSVQHAQRYDDGSMEVSLWGDGSDDGVSKWIEVGSGMIGGNASLWIYGQAVTCNVSTWNSFRIRVNDNASQEMSFDWCSLFGKNTGSALTNSGYEWIKFSIPSEWLVVGENKFNFWDTSSHLISNWNVGADTGSYFGRSAWCSNCGLYSNPPQGHNMTNKEAMMFLTNSKVINAGDTFGIETSRTGTILGMMAYINRRGRELQMDSNSWSNILFSFNGTAIDVSVNTVNRLSSAVSNIYGLNTVTETMRIGGFNGTIDEVRVYNRAIY